MISTAVKDIHNSEVRLGKHDDAADVHHERLPHLRAVTWRRGDSLTVTLMNAGEARMFQITPAGIHEKRS
jgi:hypothetical protein